MSSIEKQCKGICPQCGSPLLEYRLIEYIDDMVYYPFECGECYEEGKEYYTLVYAITTD